MALLVTTTVVTLIWMRTPGNISKWFTCNEPVVHCVHLCTNHRAVWSPGGNDNFRFRSIPIPVQADRIYRRVIGQV